MKCTARFLQCFVCVPLFLILPGLLFSCKKEKEYTLEEIEKIIAGNGDLFLKNTVSKPYEKQDFKAGNTGGTWNDTILDDPKTFNILIAERDGSSNALVSKMQDYLIDFDYHTRQWKPRCADYKISTDSKSNTLTVHYTLHDDLFWTYYGSSEKIPVTSDDVVWWYNEVEADPVFASSAYSGHFITMEDGSQQKIECVKTGEKTFDFIFPRIVADPLLATNTNLTPSFVYKAAKDKGGAEGLKKLFTVACDVKTIPSCGMFYLVEYTPGQRLVYKRNPFYHKKIDGTSIPFYNEMVLQIVGDHNTDYLLFREGKTELYSPTPEQLDEVIQNAADKYTVYNAEGSFGASFWSFNQNPSNKDKKFYSWFTKKEFRQAMSCLLNRDRISSQVYRGLAQPKIDFFPEINPYYNPDIVLEYLYNLERAKQLLLKIGFTWDSEKNCVDPDGNKVEFDLTISSGGAVVNDIAQIISDECSKIGITVNIRQTDFQKVIEMLTSTFDWQSVIIGLGANAFPSQGSNVWPSSGNLHLWYPSQESPATEWEARVDYLYNEGSYTVDPKKAKEIWDEEQRIILEQCPIIYLMKSRSFCALNNRWDSSNFYFDNKDGAQTEYIYLKDSD